MGMVAVLVAVVVISVIFLGAYAMFIGKEPRVSRQEIQRMRTGLALAERALYEIGFHTTDLYAKGKADATVDKIRGLYNRELD